MAREYKVEVVVEGVLGSLVFGASKLPVKKMEERMNELGRQGWDVTFMVIEKKRLLLFWEREAAVITYSRPLNPMNR